MVIGGGLGGWMGAHYGWRAASTALGLFGMVYAVICALAIRDRSPESSVPSKPRSFLHAAAVVFRLPAYQASLFAVFASLSVANWVVCTWLPSPLGRALSASSLTAAFAATFYLQASSLIGVSLGGWLGGSLGFAREIAPGLLLQAAGYPIAAALLLFLMASLPPPSRPLLAEWQAFGIGRGIYDANAMPALCQIAPADLRATGYGLLQPHWSAGRRWPGAAGAGALKSTIGIGGSGFRITSVLLGISGRLSWPTLGPVAPKS